MGRYFFLFLLLFFFCCREESGRYPDILVDRMQEREELYVSDFADSVFFIPLHNDKPLSHLITKTVCDSGVYFGEGLGRAMRFYDLKGRFVRQYGDVGHGPGEYRFSFDFCVGGDGKIYFYDNCRLLVYSGTGKFLMEKDLAPLGINWINDMVCRGDKLYISVDESSSGAYSWFVTDTCGRFIGGKRRSPDKWLLNANGNLYRGADSSVCWWSRYSDTIFELLDNGDSRIRHVWSWGTAMCYPDLGNYRFKSDGIMKSTEEPYPDALRFFSFYELPDGRCTGMFCKGAASKSLWYLYDPRMKSGYYSSRIVDDLSGLNESIPRMKINSRRSDGAYMCTDCLPLKLKEWVASEELANLKVKTPRFKQQLKELADRLDEEDNAVVVVYRLKK